MTNPPDFVTAILVMYPGNFISKRDDGGPPKLVKMDICSNRARYTCR